MSSNQTTEKQNSGYGAGMFIGALFGSGALFFFGTKTGKKIKKQLQQEFKDGSFDFESIKKDTQKRLQQIIEKSNLHLNFSNQNNLDASDSQKPKKTKNKNKKRLFSNTK